MGDTEIEKQEKDAAEDEALAAKKRLEELKQARNNLSGAEDLAVNGEALSGVDEASGANEKAAGALDGLLSAGQTQRKEVSATTIGRMMGLVTLPELKVVEGKIDVLSSRVNSLFVKIDKLVSVLGDAATGSDLERIDVQLAGLRTLVKESLTNMKANAAEKSDERVSNARILSNDE